MMADSEYERKKAEYELNEKIKESIKESTKSLENFKDAQKEVLKNYKIIKEMSAEVAHNNKKIVELEKLGTEESLKEAAALKKTNEYLTQEIALRKGINKELGKGVNLLKSAGNELINGAKTLKNEFIPSLSQVFQKFLEIDDLAHKTANTIGFQGSKFKYMEANIKESNIAFNKMGFAMGSAYEVQQSLSDATGRQVTLSTNAATAMAETARITGMLPTELATMVGQMEAFGMGAQQSTNIIYEMSRETSAMGVNSGKVIKKFQENLGLLNKLNFKNGVRGLKDMAIFSEKFKIDMQDVAAVADKVFRPEGAIEAAAQLQVLGGSLAALGDPFTLMYKARNAPEELAKSLTQAASASATWDETTKDWKINANELDRLREAANALGMDYSKLAEMAKQTKKIGSFEDILKSKFKDKKLIDAVTGMAQMGEKGAFINIIDPDGKSREVLLKDLNETQAKTLLDDTKKREELAKRSESINNQFDAIKNSIMESMIGVFKDVDWGPIMKNLEMVGGAIVQFVNWAKGFFGPELLIVMWGGLTGLIAAAFLVAGLIFGKMASIPITTAFTVGGTAAAAQITAAMATGGGAGTAGTAGTVMSKKGKSFAADSPQGRMIATKGGTQELAKQTTAMDSQSKSMGNMGKTASVSAGQILAFGAAILMIGGGIWLAADGLSHLVAAFKDLTGPQALGAVAAIAVVMGGFVAIIYAMVPAIAALGAVGAGVAIPLLALGAALLMIGGAIALAAFGVSMIVDSFTAMFSVIGDKGSGLLSAGVGFMAMAAGVGILTMSLIGLGAASFLALPGLLILGGVTSMLTNTAAALQASGGSSGISSTIEAINSVDKDKLEALKELSMFMALLGGTTTIKFDENLTVDGNIQISGQAGGKTNTDWIDDAMFISALKEKIMKNSSSERTAPGRNQ